MSEGEDFKVPTVKWLFQDALLELKRQCRDPCNHHELKQLCHETGVNIQEFQFQNSMENAWTDAGRMEGTLYAEYQVDDHFNVYQKNSKGVLEQKQVARFSLGDNKVEALCVEVPLKNLSVGTNNVDDKEGIPWGSREHLEVIVGQMFTQMVIERLKDEDEEFHNLSFKEKMARSTDTEKEMARKWLETLQESIEDHETAPLYVEFVVVVQDDPEKEHYMSLSEYTYDSKFTAEAVSIGDFNTRSLLPKGRHSKIGIDDYSTGKTYYYEGKAIVNIETDKDMPPDPEIMPTDEDTHNKDGPKGKADPTMSMLMDDSRCLIPVDEMDATIVCRMSAGVDVIGPSKGLTRSLAGTSTGTSKGFRQKADAPKIPDFEVYEASYKKSNLEIGDIKMVGPDRYPRSMGYRVVMTPPTIKMKVGKVVVKNDGLPFSTAEMTTLLTRILQNFKSIQTLLSKVTAKPYLQEVEVVSGFNEAKATEDAKARLEANKKLTVGPMGSTHSSFQDPSLSFLFEESRNEEARESPPKKTRV